VSLFSDRDFEKAGARIVYSPEEVYRRADLVLKVGAPIPEEAEWPREGSIVMGFPHLAASRREVLQALLLNRVTAIAYETVEQDDGTLPVLMPLSQVAGRMASQIAARLLQNDHGGKGILVGGMPGVPPAEVVIIGAGTVGAAAAEAFLAIGASVYVLDKDLARPQRLEWHCRTGRRPVMMVSHEFNVRKVVKFADVLVGAGLVPGARTPVVVTREVVQSMRQRSVILDIAIDQGGCVETSRPTTHTGPTFVEEVVIHYCVPNLTSVAARPATHAFNSAAWPLMSEIARSGLDGALAKLPAPRRGVATHDGQVVNRALAAHLHTAEAQQ
jgi:alanine dehydrogenase